MFSKIFLLMFIVPLVELLILIKVSFLIGFGYTILLSLMTAALGTYLARSQGLTVWFETQSQLASGITPTQKLMEGVGILIAAVLLMTPGIFTDIIGFTLLIPKSRIVIISSISKKVKNQNFNSSNFYQKSSPREEKTEYEIIED